MSFFAYIQDCLCGASDENAAIVYEKANDMKYPQLHKQYTDEPAVDEKVVQDIFDLLMHAKGREHETNARIKKVIHQLSPHELASWFESIAKGVLEKLESVIESGKDALGPGMKDAYEEVRSAAEAIADFTKHHPILITVIALGMLVILAPYILELLGFTALGPAEGSFAAAWQSMYGGVVESGSLFSYLQKLGMLYGM